MWPLQIARKLGVHFSESFHLFKDQMRINKFFHIADTAHLVIPKPVGEKFFSQTGFRITS